MAMKPIFRLFCGLAVVASVTFGAATQPGYYGTKIGPLSELHHGVSGDVYAIDSRTILLKNFNYDGEGPAAYFYVGNGTRISNKGATRLRDERGQAGVIHRYRKRDVQLQLPDGMTLRDIRWIAIWCDEFSVNFGDVKIPKNFQFPKPQKIDALSGVHGVASDNIVIVDAQTLLVPNFSYDGEAPDAKFWVGYGQKPTPNGIRIPNENGREHPLAKYDRQTIVLTLPGDLTVFEIGHFGIWCEAFTVDFGHVRIPQTLNVPPSLRMLGISPESKLNCEVLHAEKSFEVRWAIAGDSVVVQLLAKLDDNEYMSFGLSADPQTSVMVGADVTVAWLDQQSGKGNAVDYFLADKSQCSGKRGSCPDSRIDEQTVDSVRPLNAALVQKFSIVTYQRPLKAADELDLTVMRNGSQAIVWAIGPLNERKEVSFHTHFNRHTQLIDFGRKPLWNCQLPDGNMPVRSMNGDGDDGDDVEEDEEADGDVGAVAVSPVATREDVTNVGDDETDEDYPAAALPPPPPPQRRRPMRPNSNNNNSNRGGENRRQEVVGPAPDDTVLIDDQQHHRNRGPTKQQSPAQPQQFVANNRPDSSPSAGAIVGNNNNHNQIAHNVAVAPLPASRRPVPSPAPASRAGAWEIPPIQCYEPEDGVFYAQMGPTGGRQGYPAITGHVGWGISWYINGLLIPEINVVRGRTYTFVVESGNDPEVAAKYHPFYITDDPIGGYEYKTDEEKRQVRIYAGVHRSRSSGHVAPIGTGRLCNWTPDPDGPPADEYSSFGAYQRSLTLKCDEGEAGIIVWRPDEHTPDTVYYQCFTHRHLGWRINVHDQCDEDAIGAASNVGGSNAVYAAPPAGLDADDDLAEAISGGGLLSEASIRHETKVRPNELFLQQQHDLIKNHNMNEVPPRVKFDVNKNLEISKLITEGIRAAEELEESIARPTNRTTKPSLSASPASSYDAERIEFQVISKQPPAILHNPKQPQQKQHEHQPHHLLPPTQPKNPAKDQAQYVSETSSLSEYLRPPGVKTGPLFRPVKVAGRPRQPAPTVELRRPTGVGSKSGPYRQTALPQPSIIVNHYKKPIPALIRPFVKQQKPPIHSLASVLLLGQPTELSPSRKTYDPKLHSEHQAGKNGPYQSQHRKPLPSKTVHSFKSPPHKNNVAFRDSPYHNKYTLSTSSSEPVLTVVRKNAAASSANDSERLPHLPLKAAKGTFKGPYEITGPKILSDVDDHKLFINGFQPDTLIVEGGFKPIVRRRNDNRASDVIDDGEEIMQTSNRRSDDNIAADTVGVVDTVHNADSIGDDANEVIHSGGSKSDAAISGGHEGDALFVNHDMPTALFEPMFIPSPPDSINSSSKSKPQLHSHRLPDEHMTGDLIDMEVEDGDDKMAMAGERVDAYYLPPDMPRTPPHASVFPEGSIVTYDGKAVLDTSLVNSLPLPFPPISTYVQQNSVGGSHRRPLTKTEQLVRYTPQFGPFRGEIPPIGLDFALPEAPSVSRQRLRPEHLISAEPSSGGGQKTTTVFGSVAEDELQAPLREAPTPQRRPVVTEYTNPLTNSTAPISTRLVLINPLASRNKRGDEKPVDLSVESAAKNNGDFDVVSAGDEVDSMDGIVTASLRMEEPERQIKVKGVVL